MHDRARDTRPFLDTRDMIDLETWKQDIISGTRIFGYVPLGFIKDISLSVKSRIPQDKPNDLIDFYGFYIGFSTKPGPLDLIFDFKHTGPSGSGHEEVFAGFEISEEELEEIDGTEDVVLYSQINPLATITLDGPTLKLIYDIVDGMDTSDPTYEYGISCETGYPMAQVNPCNVAVVRGNPLTFTVDNPADMVYDEITGSPLVTKVFGDVTLDSGYNTELSVQAGTVTISTGAGLGKGFAPNRFCGITSNKLSGVAPVDGNIDIVGDECHPLQLVGINQATSTASFMVHGICGACCDCSDYANVLKAIGKVGDIWRLQRDKIKGLVDNYNRAKDDLGKVIDFFSQVQTVATGYMNVTLPERSFFPVTITTPVAVQGFMGLTLCDPNYTLVDGAPTRQRTVRINSIIMESRVSFLYKPLPGAPHIISVTTTNKRDDPEGGETEPVIIEGNCTDSQTVEFTFPEDFTIDLNPGTTLEIDIAGSVFPTTVISVGASNAFSVFNATFLWTEVTPDKPENLGAGTELHMTANVYTGGSLL